MAIRESFSTSFFSFFSEKNQGDSSGKKNVLKQFLLLSLNVPYHCLFPKIQLKDRSPCLFKRYVRPNLPYLGLCWYLSCATIYWFTYILQWPEASVSMVELEKNLTGTKSQVYCTML